jgi:alkanesulfonate monooxygenase SsuD/methylene tetrahydromethanopterin reductase-like flavin-dependent oxidoreductase (luciferase family)
VCDAVDGRFLNESSMDALRAAAQQAHQDGMDAVFLTDGPLGDPATLAAALSAVTTDIRLGVCTSLREHPAVVAREMTTLDHVSRGRALLTFLGPFSGATAEAITLCRDMWRQGTGVDTGPHYRVPGAVNRPGPYSAAGPLVALDSTGGAPFPPSLVALCDLLLVPAGAALPHGLPPGVDVCQIHNA